LSGAETKLPEVTHPGAHGIVRYVRLVRLIDHVHIRK